MNILGISSHYHDSAVCLVSSGSIIAAAHEERFTRIKHDSSFPSNAIDYCLSQLQNGAQSVDLVAFYDNWALKRRRSLENSIRYRYKATENLMASVEGWSKEKDFGQGLRESLGWSNDQANSRVSCVQHHFSHAASAYYCAPFDEAAIITVDGVGEYSTTTIGYGRGAKLMLERSVDFPHSLGLLYSAITWYLGFKVNSGEYKVMGLAPYGVPRYKNHLLEKVIRLDSDGSFDINLEYFRYHLSREMCNVETMKALFGFPPRQPDDPIESQHKDLAASIQAVIEISLGNLITAAVKQYGIRDVCLAGGVALNCSALGKLRNTDVVDNLFIQPAAGDAGGAMGAALALYHYVTVDSAKTDSAFTVYNGPSIKPKDAREYFLKRGCPYDEKSDKELIDHVARALADGYSIAWCQGKVEWGPRALGSRSILANPMVPGIKKTLNLKIKQREGFRPFAPIVLEHHMQDLFINGRDSPYMSFVFFLTESLRPADANLTIDGQQLSAEIFLHVKNAVIHEDFSARVQSLTLERNGLYFGVMNRFFELTGCPFLINTSFNARGEPMVLDTSDGFRCFMRTNIDKLVVGNYILDRLNQPLLQNHEIERFELD